MLKWNIKNRKWKKQTCIMHFFDFYEKKWFCVVIKKSSSIVHFSHDFSIKFLWNFIRFLWKALMNHQILKSFIIFLWISKKRTYFFLRKNPTTHFFLNFPPENNDFSSHPFHQQPQKSSKSRKHCKPHVKNAKKPKKRSW